MRINSPFLVKSVGRACGGVVWLLFCTLQKELQTARDACPYDATGTQRYLYSVWHDSALLAAFGGRHKRTVALTSCHRDGSFVTSVVGTLGVGTVRGSSGRSGRAAARKLMQVARTHDIVMTPDGPRGPRRQMSRGIVYLASRSGNSIVPTAFACSSAWEIAGSWTTQTIPKPFSRVALVAGDPISVPANLNTDGIEDYRQRLQSAMDMLQQRADRMIEHPRAARRLSKPVVAAAPAARMLPTVPIE
jgi:lysophospholipid acyltransferase (LPLAT)-like uncharacterized protein